MSLRVGSTMDPGPAITTSWEGAEKSLRSESC